MPARADRGRCRNNSNRFHSLSQRRHRSSRNRNRRRSNRSSRIRRKARIARYGREMSGQGFEHNHGLIRAGNNRLGDGNQFLLLIENPQARGTRLAGV